MITIALKYRIFVHTLEDDQIYRFDDLTQEQKAGMGMEYCSRPKESELESTLVVDTQDSITGQEESKED